MIAVDADSKSRKGKRRGKAAQVGDLGMLGECMETDIVRERFCMFQLHTSHCSHQSMRWLLQMHQHRLRRTIAAHA